MGRQTASICGIVFSIILTSSVSGQFMGRLSGRVPQHAQNTAQTMVDPRVAESSGPVEFQLVCGDAAVCSGCDDGVGFTISDAGGGASFSISDTGGGCVEADCGIEPDCGIEAAASSGCGDSGCGGGCGPATQLRLYGEFLYLRSRNAEVAYAVPVDGPIAPTLGNGIQIGPTAVVDADHRAGFRTGMNLVLDDGCYFETRYTHFESSATDQAFRGGPDVLRSLVTHPLGINAASDTARANAAQDIDFDMVDLAYFGSIYSGPRTKANYMLGVRYAELGQQFTASFDTIGNTSVDTDVDFSGVGPRVGLRLDRDLCSMGLFLYGQGDANFMVGSFDARYRQSDVFGGTLVNTGWESGRIVSQLDLEVGFGWALGGFRMSTGYLLSAWFNAVNTSEFIDAVQSNDFGGLGDGISFDGLVVRGEVRF